ncbi:LysM peptidoglycan-binding domain-containing protein [Kribbella sp. NPDC056861]|uniref:LysM peptidoglycan-binding domain-containing protein n=1 Tax=Kribbella sp. NPDC056861 TaxID=3154857 RepID=UPI00341C80C6
MNATIRGLKGLLALSALAGLGLLLRWVTAGSIEAATAQDLTSLASLAIGAVAWAAYCWLVIAVLATVLEQAPGFIGRSASVVATRITSQGSRTLLRSALGVAAVTPLTIGVAQATPGDGSYRAVESRSTIQLTGDSNSRPWAAVEPRSTVNLTGGSPTSPRPWAATEPRSTVNLTDEPSAGRRPWSAVEPRSTVQLGEKPSVGNPAASKPVQQARPTTTDAAKPRRQTSASRTAVPNKPVGRTAVPAKPPVSPIAVPDRPTTGAPTRYTTLQSGHLTRAASHLVKPGESLWSIAAAELGPGATDDAIATRWPQWYAANRQLIGPDPNVIHPGQVLTAPAPVHPVPPTYQEK